MCYGRIRSILEEATVRINKLKVPYEEEFQVQIQYLNLHEKQSNASISIASLSAFYYPLCKESNTCSDWLVNNRRLLVEDPGVLYGLGHINGQACISFASFFSHMNGTWVARECYPYPKKAKIFTASEYILRLSSQETIQQVMNDLLEVQHILLADLVSNSLLDTESSTTLKAVLHDSFSSVLDDLIADPNVVPCNYLDKCKAHLDGQELSWIRLQHMQLLLTKENTYHLSDAIGLQTKWRSECKKWHGTSLGRIMNEIVIDHGSSIETLFSMAKAMNVSWKYFLSMLHLVIVAIDKNKVETVRVKGILKDLFLQVVASGDFHLFLLLIISAREVCVSNVDVLGSYAMWYKSTFGEMTYRTKKEQFVNVTELLTKMIVLEKDPEMLKVHINISVSTPPKCMELIVAYKQLCRAQLAKLQIEKNSSTSNDAQCETSIVIDD